MKGICAITDGPSASNKASPNKPGKNRSPHLPSPGAPGPKVSPKVEPRSQGWRLFNENRRDVSGKLPSIPSVGFVEKKTDREKLLLGKSIKSGFH